MKEGYAKRNLGRTQQVAAYYKELRLCLREQEIKFDDAVIAAVHSGGEEMAHS